MLVAARRDANSGGIWQPVTLRLSRGAAIDNLTALPDWRQGLARPTLNIRLDYRVNRPKARLILRLTPLNFTGKSYRLSRRVTLTGEAPLAVSLPMPGAALWWPYGHGAQHLYRIEATLSDAEGLLDRHTSQTGLRDVRELASGHGWTINGRRLFIRGTNYIGSPWLGSMTAPLYRRDLLLMRAANINAVRVHGHVAGGRCIARPMNWACCCGKICHCNGGMTTVKPSPPKRRAVPAICCDNGAITLR